MNKDTWEENWTKELGTRFLLFLCFCGMGNFIVIPLVSITRGDGTDLLVFGILQLFSLLFVVPLYFVIEHMLSVTVRKLHTYYYPLSMAVIYTLGHLAWSVF